MFFRGANAGAVVRAYDDAIYEERDRFRDTQMYNFFTNNCHTYTACCLERAGVDGGASWNMVKLAALMFFKGKYVSVGRFMAAHLPFFILVAIIVAVSIGTTHGTSK